MVHASPRWAGKCAFTRVRGSGVWAIGSNQPSTGLIGHATKTNLCARHSEEKGSAVKEAAPPHTRNGNPAGASELLPNGAEAGGRLRRGAQHPSAPREPTAPDPRRSAPDRSRTSDSERLEDDEAFELLRMILVLRREVEQDGKAVLQRADYAAAFCYQLVRGLMGWGAERIGFLMPPSDYAKLPLEERRRLTAENILLGLPVFQDKERMELVHGLRALNLGQEDPFVRKTNTGRRRAAPGAAALAELDLLKWVRWQHGLGRKVADAETDVAQAVGCTREAIQKWRAELPKVFGAAFVRNELELAQDIGEFEARQIRAGRWPANGVLELDDVLQLILSDDLPWASDRGHELCMGWACFDRDLSEIAERRRAAVAKRRVAKSGDK
jgi:hypothetical protein